MKWVPFEDGSFGIVSRNLIREIQRREIKLPWVGAIIAGLDAPELPPNLRFVLFFVWELTSLHRSRIGRVEHIHQVVGISNHAAKILQRYDIPAAPGQLGVDANIFRPLEVVRQSGAFTFGTVVAANPRSGLDILLKAFQKAFGSSKDVLLKIKLYSPHEPKLMRYIESFHINVEVIDRYWSWSEAQMCTFYNSLDCFVYPIRTTAWGMPLSEASACGVPCIVTDYSAPPEFIDDEIGWLIPAKEVEVDWEYCRRMHEDHGWIHHWPESGYLHFAPTWGEPDVEPLASLMQEAASAPDMVREKGKKARRRMVERFTWGHALNRILEALQSHEEFSHQG